jgi:SM-20-related protein
VQALQLYLNKQLLLGLFSFESHFSHYAPGDYYKRHKDAFKGEANRVLSLVLYLNSAWQQDDGGELVLYAPEDERPGALASCGIDDGGLKVTPLLGTWRFFSVKTSPTRYCPLPAIAMRSQAGIG